MEKKLCIEARQEILNNVLSSDSQYAYQEIEKILRRVKANICKNRKIDVEEYSTNSLTANLYHSELLFNDIWWARGENLQDNKEMLKSFAREYIEALDSLIIKD